MIEPEPRSETEKPAKTRNELLGRLIEEIDRATEVAPDDKLFVIRSLQARLVSPERSPS